ncbi:hypothetical protein C8R45DRAFT_1095855 [Mycena sanguinolenta]|nr:hypothetical protein C8R45DRAFT_1095855 [Mycena sanguinolenta]
MPMALLLTGTQPDSDPHQRIDPKSFHPDADDSESDNVQTINIKGGSGGRGGLGFNQGTGGDGGTGEGPNVTFHNSAQQLTMINMYVHL